MDTILTEEKLEAMNKIKEMMSKMSTKQMLDSIQDLKQDMSLLEEQLDRFIELFERIRAEQVFDELIKQLEKLVESQIKISGELYSEDANFDDVATNPGDESAAYKNQFVEFLRRNRPSEELPKPKQITVKKRKRRTYTSTLNKLI